MKRNILATLSLVVMLASCQKEMSAPAVNNSAHASASNNIEMISPTPVATFSASAPDHKIKRGTADIIFSDSIYITENKAYLQVLKFDVQGNNLSFENYVVLVNAERSVVTGSYENGLLTVVLNKKKPLPIGGYNIEVKAKVKGPSQIFTLGLQQGNAIVTDHYGFIANINGLPVQSSVGLK